MYTINPVIRFDPAKSERNRLERGFGFELADEFEWETARVSEDQRRDYGEKRMTAIGLIAGRLHVLVFTPRGETLHVISLRKTNRRDRALYEAQTEADATVGRESCVDSRDVRSVETG